MTATLKGNFIYWDIQGDLEISRDEFEKKLSTFGSLASKVKKCTEVTDLIPRNDYKSAMIRALRRFVKERRKEDKNSSSITAYDPDHFYRKTSDPKESATFVVLLSQLQMDKGEIDVAIEKEGQLTLNKSLGTVEYAKKFPGHDQINAYYKEALQTIDKSIFRTVADRFIKSQCYGVNLRSYGGVYYVAASHKDAVANLRELFNMFSDCKLFEVPVYDNVGTNEAVEFAIEEEVEADIRKICTEIKNKEGKLTGRLLEGRKEAVQDLLGKLKVHEQDMRSKSSSLKTKVKELDILVNKAIDNILVASDGSTFNISDAMDSLLSGKI